MNKLIDKKAQKRCMITYAVIFVVLFFLCMLFPYTLDDWAWGGQIGLNRLSTWFDNYSGRYFGNLIVLALTRSNLLKSFVMSFCITGIAVLIDKLTGKQKNGVFIILSLLIFMPVSLFRQTIAWTSGFANYTTSIFLTLIYIYYVRNIYGESKPKKAPFDIVPLFILGAANTLIVEHLTMYNIVLAVYVILFTIIKFKKVYIQHVAYFIGTVAGTLLMFSNSVYRSVADGSDDYRSIGEGGIISKAIQEFFNTIVPDGFMNNFVLNVFIAVVCLITWIKIKDKLSKLPKVLGALSIAVIIAFASSSLIIKISAVTPLKLLTYAEGAATIVYVLALIVFLFILPLELNKKVKLLFILGSVGCMIAPLLVVSPISSRCFFASYVMLIYLAMELYSLFDEDIKEQLAKISNASVIVVAVGLLFLFYIYGTIAVNNQERLEKVKKEAETATSETVELESLPYKHYLWGSDIPNAYWSSNFKAYYGIDENVNVVSSKK